jgi:hypothetical protein
MAALEMWLALRLRLVCFDMWSFVLNQVKKKGRIIALKMRRSLEITNIFIHREEKADH